MHAGMSKKKRPITVNSCPYEECVLPTSNWKYNAQAVYLIVSLGILCANRTAFSFVSIGLFAAPVLLDLCSTELFGKFYKAFKQVLAVYNTGILGACLCGIGGLLQDTGDMFVVPNTSVILANYWISKTVFVFLLLPDLIVPLVLCKACPTKKTLVTEHIADSKSRNGVK